jgi:aminopeptidase
MKDPRIQNLARILVDYSVAVKPKDLVAITILGELSIAKPLVVEVLRRVLQAGGYPHLLFDHTSIEELAYVFFSEANADQLQHIDPFYEKCIKEFDCRIGILCESDSRELSSIDPSRLSAWSRAYAELIKIKDKRAMEGSFRWVVGLYPTSGYAQDAEMSLEEYENFAFAASGADLDDPMMPWKLLGEKQKKLVDWLAGKKHVELKGPHVDLSFSIEGRSFENCDGRKNMPDGEIFTGPVEDSVNGWIESTFPANYFSVEVGKVALRFEKGRVVHAQSEKHQEHLTAMIETDEGSHRLGEFGIGTNQGIKKFTKNMLFDEKIAGTIHVALGKGYKETGSLNESSIHWDFLCDMRQGGQIIIDGQTIYDSGEFLI